MKQKVNVVVVVVVVVGRTGGEKTQEKEWKNLRKKSV